MYKSIHCAFTTYHMILSFQISIPSFFHKKDDGILGSPSCQCLCRQNDDIATYVRFPGRCSWEIEIRHGTCNTLPHPTNFLDIPHKILWQHFSPKQLILAISVISRSEFSCGAMGLTGSRALRVRSHSRSNSFRNFTRASKLSKLRDFLDGIQLHHMNHMLVVDCPRTCMLHSTYRKSNVTFCYNIFPSQTWLFPMRSQSWRKWLKRWCWLLRCGMRRYSWGEINGIDG